MIPIKGPKKDPKVSIKDKAPIWLNKVSQKIPIIKPKIKIIIATFFKLSLEGIKFNKEFCVGI